MSVALKEWIKNFIIFILIVAGVIQVGILFGYQSQGTPTNFIMRLFDRNGSIGYEQVKERLFDPEKLILSDGAEFQIIGKDSGTFRTLWENAQKNLESIAMGELNLKASDEQWVDLIEKKGIIVDFGYTVNGNLMKWFLGKEKSGKDFPDIRKILIKPDIDLKTGLIYTYDGLNKIYVSDAITFDESIHLDRIYDDFVDNEKNREYVSFKSANLIEDLDAPPDLLYVNSGATYWPYNEYGCKIPERVKNVEEFAKAVLGNDIDRYSSSQKNGTYQWYYNKNVYRLYPDGSMTYNYQDTAKASEKGSVGDALTNAYKLVDRINRLSNTDANILLSDITEMRTGVYKISFDYYLDDMKVRLDNGFKTRNGTELKHAIKIQADSKRVLECEWLMRDFSNAKKGKYDDRYMDLMPKSGFAFDELPMNDVKSGYLIKSSGDETLRPSLLIDLKDNSILQIEMTEGD
jgi:hypothetical protein